jgi:hypothetical protein
VEIFAEGLGLGSEAVRRAKARHMISTMVGGLTLARAMSDPGAPGRILAQASSACCASSRVTRVKPPF